MKKIKFEYIFDTGKKTVITLDQIQSGILADYYCNGYGKVIHRRIFTGLTDKNGKDIYEGDIVLMHQFLFDGHECENELKGVIEYSGLGLMISKIECMPYSKYTGQNDGEGKDYIVNFYGLHEESFEVIGNIHENPELLSTDKTKTV
jgi:uncharacterized phage protein (TIGR01671 family)